MIIYLSITFEVLIIKRLKEKDGVNFQHILYNDFISYCFSQYQTMKQVIPIGYPK